MRQQTKGFTLIELMLAMTFVSVLLIAIAMLTIQIGNIYTRGVTLKQVNEAGLELSNDLQRTIQTGEEFNLQPAPTDPDNKKYVLFEGGKSGRLCVGKVSYAWNLSELALQTGNSLPNHYSGTSSTKQLRFVKVVDAGGALCKSNDSNTYPAIEDNDKTTELLATGDRNLALHSFSITGNNKGLYAVTLTIGTDDAALLNAERSGCKPPAEISGQENYCAVNTFDIVARTGSKEGAE